MAGIWERVANRGESDSPIGSAALMAAVYFATRGMFTPKQVRNKLERTLSSPLTDDDEADIAAIVTQASAGTPAAKADYMHRLHALLIAAETGMINSETVFRTELGIA